jgi:ribosomal protein L16 Arg81 hydroxylase
MEWNIISDLLTLVLSGGLGALIMQFYMAKVNKRKAQAEAEAAKVDAEQKKQDLHQDAFDTMYSELNKCMADYTTLSEEYREYRNKAREHEEVFQAKVASKCEELASLKSQINYLKGLRCYNTLCPSRIKLNPDKKADKTEEPQEP